MTTMATRTSQISIFDNENNSFARLARAFFICDISQTFSFFPRRGMTCFAVVWRTRAYDDKSSILSSYF